MTTNPALQKLAERLAKATPEELTGFAERLAKRAEHIAKAKDFIGKAMKHHEDLDDGLEKLKNANEDLENCKSTATGDLQKATGAVSDLMKTIHGELQKAADGIGESLQGVSGSIEDYESEAEDQVNAGIAASMRHPDFGTQKMVKTLTRELEATNRRLEKVLKASDDRMAAVISGLTNGLTKAATPVPATPIPSRTAISIEESADGTGAATLVKLNGQAAPDITTGVSPVMIDGVTPNPEFTKLADSTGDACEKALRSAKPQVGNPFVGIEDLVSKRHSA